MREHYSSRETGLLRLFVMDGSHDLLLVNHACLSFIAFYKEKPAINLQVANRSSLSSNCRVSAQSWQDSHYKTRHRKTASPNLMQHRQHAPQTEVSGGYAFPNRAARWFSSSTPRLIDSEPISRTVFTSSTSLELQLNRIWQRPRREKDLKSQNRNRMSQSHCGDDTLVGQRSILTETRRAPSFFFIRPRLLIQSGFSRSLVRCLSQECSSNTSANPSRHINTQVYSCVQTQAAFDYTSRMSRLSKHVPDTQTGSHCSQCCCNTAVLSQRPAQLHCCTLDTNH
jgi:hypothetical protein